MPADLIPLETWTTFELYPCPGLQDQQTVKDEFWRTYANTIIKAHKMYIIITHTRNTLNCKTHKHTFVVDENINVCVCQFITSRVNWVVQSLAVDYSHSYAGGRKLTDGGA